MQDIYLYITRVYVVYVDLDLPEIHLWCYTRQSFDGQQGNWLYMLMMDGYCF